MWQAGKTVNEKVKLPRLRGFRFSVFKLLEGFFSHFCLLLNWI